MFTLLPEQHKKRLAKEYRTRLVVVLLVFVSAYFLINIAFLFPSYISLESKKNIHNIELSSLKDQISVKDNQGLEALVNKVRFEVLLAKPDETEVYAAIKKILEHVSGGISLTILSYTRGENTSSTLNIQGIAKDRSSLLSFTNNLKKDLMFSAVNLPVSNLAKQTDVKFNMTVLGKF